jgi:hypothetical protein
MMVDSNVVYAFSVLFGGIASLLAAFFLRTSSIDKALFKIKKGESERIHEDLLQWASDVSKLPRIEENEWSKLMSILAIYNDIRNIDSQIKNYKRNLGWGIIVNLITAVLALLTTLSEFSWLIFGWSAFISFILLWLSITTKNSIDTRLKRYTEPYIFKGKS